MRITYFLILDPCQPGQLDLCFNHIELLRFMSGGRVVGVGGVQTLQMLHMPYLTIPTILKFTTLK